MNAMRAMTEKIRRRTKSSKTLKHPRRISFNLALLLVALLLRMPSSFFAVAEVTDYWENHATLPPSRHSLRAASLDRKIISHRRVEDAGWNNNDDASYYTDDVVKNAEGTFLDMFYTSPSTWTALEWGFFAGMMTLFGVCFFCWCLVCIIPQCCGHRAAALAYASMT